MCGETEEESMQWWDEMCRAEELEGEALAAAIMDGDDDDDDDEARERDERGGLLI